MTLLELMVAVAVLAIGSIAAMRAMDQSRLSLGGAMPRLMAQIVAQNRAEELRLLGLSRGRALPSQVQMGPYLVRVSLDTEVTAIGVIRTAITARSGDGPGAYLVTFLPPTTGN